MYKKVSIDFDEKMYETLITIQAEGMLQEKKKKSISSIVHELLEKGIQASKPKK